MNLSFLKRAALPVLVTLFVGAMVALPIVDNLGIGADKAGAADFDPNALGRTDRAPKAPAPGCEHDSYDTAAGASSAFGLNVFREYSDTTPQDKNIVLSPLSLSVAFQMLSNGATDETWAPLLTAMCLHGSSVSGANDETSDLLRDLAIPKNGVEVTFANGIFTEQQYRPSPPLVQVVRDQFDGTFDTFDSLQPQATADKVNEWAAQKTKGRVTKLLQASDIEPTLAMILTNAVTFDGTWQSKFNADVTRPAKFTHADKSTSKVAMMSETISADFAYADEAQMAIPMARLPYGDSGRVGATFIVPTNSATMTSFVDKLTFDRWRELRESMQQADVHVSIPKFRVDTLADLKNTVLDPSVGIPERRYNNLFNPPPRPPDFAYIEFVKQADMLQMDEAGTKAAAVTAIGAGFTAGFDSGPELIADHPFLVVIDDEKTGAILFVARITNPGDGSNVSPDA